MSLQKIHMLLANKVPTMALPHCVELWHEHKFRFRISGERKTKLGDYKFDPANGQHTISVNGNLNPYSFLITYVHEVAHCANVIKHGRKVAPHGKEWKLAFREFMLPVLTTDVFPDSVLRQLARHMKNPRASSQSDPRLVMELRKFDDTDHGLTLRELNNGEVFKLNDRTFKKIHLRRSRVLCLELKSGRNFLISSVVPVEVESR